MKQKQKAEIWKTEIRLARRLISTFAPRWRLRAESYFLHFCFSPVVDFCFLLSTFLIFPSSSSSSSWGIGDGSWKMGDGSAIFSLRSSNFHLPRLKAEIWKTEIRLARRLISTFAPRWRLRAGSYFLHFCFSPV